MDVRCEFCSRLDIGHILASTSFSDTVSGGFLLAWHDDHDHVSSCDYERTTLDHVLQNKSSCSLCCLIYEGFRKEGLDVLLSQHHAITRSRAILLRLVTPNGIPYNGAREKSLAGISFKLRRPPDSTASAHKPLFFGARLLPSTDGHERHETACASKHIGAVSQETTTDTIKAWFSECVGEHSACQQCLSGNTFDDESAESILPARVIHISETGTVRLLETKHGQTGRYVALSYCWGDVSSRSLLRLTRAQLGDFIRDVPRERLPQTILDAVVTTKALGLQLLWVDALCIIQDDADDLDWLNTVESMSDIYQGASLTIAVVGDRDSFSGFLGPRVKDDKMIPIPWTVKPPSQRSLMLSSVFSCNGSHRSDASSTGLQDELLRSRWYKRAWTFQEYLLSRRVLFFGDFQAYWQCQSAVFSEDTFDDKVSLPELGGNLKSSLQQTLGRNSFQQPSGYRPHHEFRIHTQVDDRDKQLLTALTYQYSRRTLSRPSDKLAAFTGFAGAPAGAEGRTCVYGLWLGSVGPRSLYWRHIDGAVLLQPPMQAPTWSWVNCSGGVAPALAMDHSRPLCEIRATIEHNPIMRAGSPRAKPISILINGQCLQASCLLQTCAETSRTFSQLWSDLHLSANPGRFKNVDLSWPPESCHLLFVGQETQALSFLPASVPQTRACPACSCHIRSDSESHWLSHVENCGRHSELSQPTTSAQHAPDRLIGVAYFDNNADASAQVELIPLVAGREQTSVCPPGFGKEISDRPRDGEPSAPPRHFEGPPRRSQSSLERIRTIANTMREMIASKKDDLRRQEIISHSTESDNTVLSWKSDTRSFRLRDLPRLSKSRPYIYALLLVRPYDASAQVYQRIGIGFAFWLPGMETFGGVNLSGKRATKRDITLI